MPSAVCFPSRLDARSQETPAAIRQAHLRLVAALAYPEAASVAGRSARRLRCDTDISVSSNTVSQRHILYGLQHCVLMHCQIDSEETCSALVFQENSLSFQERSGELSVATACQPYLAQRLSPLAKIHVLRWEGYQLRRDRDAAAIRIIRMLQPPH